jgi:mono/diheme cytochrome c family protein
MKRLVSISIATMLPLTMLAFFSPRAQAQSAAEKFYKSKCAMCHGADGSGNTPAGKKMGARDFRSPEVQKQTDTQLADIIAKGKKDMPGYEKNLKEGQIKELVTYIREFAKEKKK